MIDFHCHLDLYPRPQDVVRDCRERGLYILSVTTTPSAFRGTYNLAGQDNRIKTALGLHPQLAHERKGELELFDRLLPDARYIGEIGLDGAPEFRRHWNDQMEVFEHVLAACGKAGGRILSIHSRRASGAVLEQLDAHRAAGTPVLHWFSGTLGELKRAITLGCWFSVGPAMLRGRRGQELAARMPRECVLTESDGPFAQLNGRALYPWDVEHAVVALSKIWRITPTEAATTLSDNLRRLLQKSQLESLISLQGR